MNLSHAYGGYPPRENAARLLQRALDLGVTMPDTATLHGALKRLRTDHIDLYYLHRLDSRVTSRSQRPFWRILR